MVSIATSDTSEIIDAKLSISATAIEYEETKRRCLREARDQALAVKRTFDEAINEIDAELGPLHEELEILKRQRKHMITDLCEDLHHSPLESAYLSVLVDKFKTLSRERRHQPPQGPKEARKGRKKHVQSNFKRAVIERYGAERHDEDGELHYFCHISNQWLLSNQIKSAHIIPQSLSSGDLAHLFGSEAISLNDTRNGKW